MAKRKRRGLPKAPKVNLRDALVEAERIVSRVQSQLGVVNMVLTAKRWDGKDLDIGELVYVHDVLHAAEADLGQVAWPVGLPYYGSAWRDEGAA